MCACSVSRRVLWIEYGFPISCILVSLISKDDYVVTRCLHCIINIYFLQIFLSSLDEFFEMISIVCLCTGKENFSLSRKIIRL